MENKRDRWVEGGHELPAAPGSRVAFGGDNPLVRLTLHFRDGVTLEQNFKPPVPQVKAMAAFGRLLAQLGTELDIELGGNDVLTEEPRHAQEVRLEDSGAGSGKEGADGGDAARLGAAAVPGAS